MVLAIVAVSAGLATLALRDGNVTRLEREAVRLAALFEMARAEARVSGSTVRWVPGGDVAVPGAAAPAAVEGPPAAFRFVGLGSIAPLPRHWLDERVVAVVPPQGFVVLGPDAILPPQRVTLQLEDQRIDIASDGLAPFAIASPAVDEAAGGPR